MLRTRSTFACWPFTAPLKATAGRRFTLVILEVFETCLFSRSTPGRFPLGRILATPGALEAIEKASQQPQEFLDRHVNGDWGEVDRHDAAENEFSVRRGSRLLSSYTTAAGDKLWIITEADRSATTLLLPEEY